MQQIARKATNSTVNIDSTVNHQEPPAVHENLTTAQPVTRRTKATESKKHKELSKVLSTMQAFINSTINNIKSYQTF